MPSLCAHSCSSLVFPHVEAKQVEVDIGGDLQGAAQFDRAVGDAAGVFEGVGADFDLAVVLDHRVRGDLAVFQRRQGSDDLEDRARRIGTFRRPVDQRRQHGVSVKFVHLLLARFDQVGRVVGRVRAHRQDLAGVDVHRDEGPRQAPRGECRFTGALNFLVDRQLQAVTGGRRDRDQLAAGGRLAQRVDLDPGQARIAAQILVIGVLRPGLADLVTRFELFVADLFQLFSGDLTDVAEHVGGEGAVRVVANEDPLHRHPGEFAPGSLRCRRSRS